MPTKPIQEFIPIDIDPKAKEILNQFSSFLEEIVNFCSHVFRWWIDNVKRAMNMCQFFNLLDIYLI
jgi:transposase-like protein